MMEILGKFTAELTYQEISDICSLFGTIFHKHREVTDFHRQYLNTATGYSYHAIAVDNNKIVGHNAYIPFWYLKNGVERFMLVISVDAMIHPDFRGNGIYRGLLKKCECLARKDGCKIRIGFPNDNSYPIQINSLKYKDIGELSTYCLPIQIGEIKNSLRIFNGFSRLISKLLSLVSTIPVGNKNFSFIFAKERSSFDDFRYKWAPDKYRYINLPKGVTAIYCDEKYQGVNATFLIDVFPLSRRNFDDAVRGIWRLNPQACLIIYVGNLPFRPLSMIKIPKSIQPKKFHFVGKILDNDFFAGEDVADIHNWELNLSNYDLV